MKSKKTFYVTTAIDYVNARPHAGHAFEKTLADALARYKRLQGYDVFFLTGVDENAQKNVEAAQKEGIPVKEFIDKNTSLFIELCKKLNLSHDAFIRTTAKEHALVVQKIIKKIIDNGDIYKGAYEGLYCTGCEAYYTEKDLIGGKCPEHNKAPEIRKEEAYFFKLSKYRKKLLELYKENPEFILPEERKNEIVRRVNEELKDVCISRKGAKWGIDFPNEKDYKVWVWVDALINYISGLKNKEEKYWPANVHIIGKGINWFHSVIWPALLLSAGYKLPEKILVHGYLTQSKQKISKSLGNVIDPLDLLNKYSTDAIRYSLLRCSTSEDSDYDEEILITRNNNELADKLGNLVSRVSTLAEKYGIEKAEQAKELESKELTIKVSEHLNNFEFDKALNEIFSFIDRCNTYVQESSPWITKDKKVLYRLANAIKDAAILLSPFMPETCEKIAKTFNFKIKLEELTKLLKVSKIKKADILFKKIDVDVNNNQNKIIKKENVNKPSKRLGDSKEIEGIMSTNQIKFEDFTKLDMRVGTIKKVEEIEGADKLYKLEIEVGKEKKIILAGIKQYYTKDELKNKQVVVIINLEPRKLKGIESEGMILAAVSEDHSKVILISPDKEIDSGSKVQ